MPHISVSQWDITGQSQTQSWKYCGEGTSERKESWHETKSPWDCTGTGRVPRCSFWAQATEKSEKLWGVQAQHQNLLQWNSCAGDWRIQGNATLSMKLIHRTHCHRDWMSSIALSNCLLSGLWCKKWTNLGRKFFEAPEHIEIRKGKRMVLTYIFQKDPYQHIWHTFLSTHAYQWPQEGLEYCTAATLPWLYIGSSFWPTQKFWHTLKKNL